MQLRNHGDSYLESTQTDRSPQRRTRHSPSPTARLPLRAAMLELEAQLLACLDQPHLLGAQLA
jgi:hypothetical protein